MPIDPAVERSIRERLAVSEFAGWMGLELGPFDDGTSELRLPLKPHHLNPGGIVHGGVIASILDGAIGLALRTQLPVGSEHVTLALNISYIAMSRTGMIVARGTAIRTGSRAAHGEASAFDEDGRLLAKATATFMVLQPRDPGDEA